MKPGISLLAGVVSAMTTFGLVEGIAVAGEDRTSWEWQQQHQLPLHWDNITHGAGWVAGQRPQAAASHEPQYVSLGAGEWTVVAVGAGRWLRLINREATSLDGLGIMRSVDGRSFIDEQLDIDSQQQGLTRARYPQLTWVKIENRSSKPTALQFSLFTSRRSEVTAVPGYLQALPATADIATVRLGDRPGAVNYWPLAANTPMHFDVEGPMRVRLRSRLEMQPHQSSAYEPYSLQLQLDEQAYAHFDLASADERQHTVRVDGCVSALSRERDVYFDIPAGKHRLAVSSEAKQYIELTGSRAAADYLFDANAPAFKQEHANSTETAWQYEQPALALMLDEQSLPSVQQQAAQRLVRDNRFLPGGLQALDSMRAQLAFDHEAAERYRLFADVVIPRAMQTILPVAADGSLRLRQHKVIPRRLADNDSHVLLWQSQLAGLAAQQLQASFAHIADNGTTLQYRLPASTASRRLQVLLMADTDLDGESLALQLNEGNWQSLRIQELDAHSQPAYQVARADIAATLLHDELSLPVVSPYWVEIQLPAGVEQLRLQAKQAGLWVATRLEQASPYLPAERDYLSKLASLPVAQQREAFMSLLKTDPNTQAISTELHNQWLPLLRYLKLQRRYFPASREQQATSSAARSEADISRLQAHARAAEQQHDFVQAIEYWSQASRQSQGKLRDELRLQRASALMQNSDLLYANREWWNLYLDSHFDDIRQQALQAIIAQSKDDPERVVRVLAAALLERPSASLLAQLVEAMVAEGDYRRALYLGLLLDEAQRPQEAMLLAAASEGWWSVFGQALQQQADEQQRHYWAGMQKAVLADFDEALWHWRKAGSERAASASARLQTMLAIRAGLQSTERAEQQQALQNWQAMGMAEEGRWRSGMHYVVSSAGSAQLRLQGLGLNQPQHRATPDRPLRLQVQGPQRLRLLVRPLHEKTGGIIHDEWMSISINGETLHVPVLNNPADPERQLLGDDAANVGLRSVREIQLGKGLNTVELHLRKAEALVDVQRWQPVLPWSVLPDLSQPPVYQWFANGALDQFNGAVPTLADASVNEAAYCGISHKRVSVQALPGKAWPQLQGTAEKTPAGRQQPIAAELQQLFSLLWQIENNKQDRVQAALQALQLLDAQPLNSELHQYAGRVFRHVNWQAVANLERRAGSRLLQLPGIQPEHPAARVNTALLPALSDHERRLQGRDGLVLALEQGFAHDIRLVFDLEALRLESSEALRLKLQVDQQPARILAFNNSQRHAVLDVPVAAGAHSVNLQLLDPYAGQAIRVGVYERHAGSDWRRYPVAAQQRSYHVASRDEALVMHVFGPNRVRIDEWRDGATHTQYRDLPAGWQTLTLSPAQEQQQEALYRVFELVERDEAVPVPTRVPATGLARLQPALPVLVNNEAIAAPLDALPLAGQQQGTWSMSLAAASRRNLDEDGPGSDDSEDFFEWRFTHRKYLEQPDVYHRGELWLRGREQGGPTLALRETLGFNNIWEHVDLDLQASVFSQRVNHDLGTEWAADLRSRASRRYDLGQQLSHRPSLTAFARWLSLDSLPVTGSEDVDQDIYTNYKRQHLHGLQVCDDLAYQALLDVRLQAGACVTSNEDLDVFDPDNIRWHIGGQVLSGDLLLRADYAETRFREDEDRLADVTRKRLRLEADWFRWQTPASGLQLGWRFDHDPDLDDNAMWLTFSWHNSNGRYFRDFREGELPFKNIRRRLHQQRHFNNGQEDKTWQR